MRKAVASLYPNVPLEQPMTQQAQFEKSYQQQRMFAAMGGFFGVLAALLVATGLYGTHSFRVSRAPPRLVYAWRWARVARVCSPWCCVKVSGSLSLAGAGIPLTWLAVRPLKSMLYQMSPFDRSALHSPSPP